MHNGCDVCHNFRPAADPELGMFASMPIGAETVVLCEMHRRIAQCTGITTYEQLRELYGESAGRRSFVPRRVGGPGGPQGDRRRTGRRWTDV